MPTWPNYARFRARKAAGRFRQGASLDTLRFHTALSTDSVDNFRTPGTQIADISPTLRCVPMFSEKPDELRVLIINDDIEAAHSLSYLLQISGYPTAVAYGGTMGLRLAQLFRPSLVFLDLQMPVQDGCEVLAAAQRDGTLPRALYVCLTGSTDPSAQSKCQAAGFNFFVPKPMQPEALAEILRAARSHAGLRRVRWPGEGMPELIDRRAH